MKPIYDVCEDEITYNDHGEAIVFHQSLNFVQFEDDSMWFRHIFHSPCEVHVKICNVVIDGGSCENYVFKKNV